MSDMRTAFVNPALTLSVSTLPHLDASLLCLLPPRRSDGEQDLCTDIFSQSQGKHTGGIGDTAGNGFWVGLICLQVSPFWDCSVGCVVPGELYQVRLRTVNSISALVESYFPEADLSTCIRPSFPARRERADVGVKGKKYVWGETSRLIMHAGCLIAKLQAVDSLDLTSVLCVCYYFPNARTSFVFLNGFSASHWLTSLCCF